MLPGWGALNVTAATAREGDLDSQVQPGAPLVSEEPLGRDHPAEGTHS